MLHDLRAIRHLLFVGMLVSASTAIAAAEATEATARIATATRVWRERLVARDQGAPGDLSLHLLLSAAGVDADQSDLRVTLSHHAGRWMPAVVRVQSHRAERFTASFTADRVAADRVTGRLCIDVIQPPAGKAGGHGVFTTNAPRQQELVYLLDCQLAATGQVSGRYVDAPDRPTRGDRINGYWSRTDITRSLCRLLLPGAIAGRDLHLLAIADDQALHLLEARTPHWNKARHHVARTPVPFTADGYAGTVDLSLRSDGHVPADAARVDCQLSLRCSLDPATASLQGSHDIETVGNVVPASQGVIRGSVVPLASGKIPAVPRTPASEVLSELLDWADDCYHYARSAEMALRTGLPFASCHVRTGVPRRAILLPQGGHARLAAIASCIAERPAVPLVGTTLTEDPAFGPWYRQRAAPCDNAGHHRLGPEGAWVHLTRWHVLGPLRPQSFPRSLHPLLPPVVSAGASAYAGTGDPLLPLASTPAEQWRWQEVIAEEPLVDPGPLPHGASDGFAGRRYLASATIHVAHATQAWLALSGTTVHNKWGRGRRCHLAAWINDAPLWRSGARTDELREHRAVVPVTLEAGVNRILLAVDSPSTEALGFRCHLYHGPPPRTQAEVAAWNQRRRAHLAQQPGLAMTGFRGDLSGVFPQAEPVTAWDLEQGINVRWHMPLPAFSNATPLVLGDRVITLSEPHHIHCHAIADGAELWRHSACPFDEMPANESAQLRRDAARHRDLQAKRKQLRRAIRDLRGAADAQERSAALRSELAALAPQLDRAE
ncbi:MAG: hypothetical protein ACOCZK_08535, partial [Planctomycetota bacterium]